MRPRKLSVFKEFLNEFQKVFYSDDKCVGFRLCFDRHFPNTVGQLKRKYYAYCEESAAINSSQFVVVKKMSLG